ncbi:MAG: Tex family protein [Prevotella sp.]
MNKFTGIIAKTLSLPEKNVENTLALLDESCTIPFIARYRKERTGNMDEVQISQINAMNEKMTEIAKRKDTIIKTISESGMLTPAIEKQINDCWDATELEDIYLPFKPKRRTKAQIAKEQGLEPLADIIMLQNDANPIKTAERYMKHPDINSAESAVTGALHIIAERINENEKSRKILRNIFRREAIISSQVIKDKENDEKASKYVNYFDFSEPLRHCASHRLLAMRRGENDGILRVSISVDNDKCIEKLKQQYVRRYNQCGKLVGEAVEDAYKRLTKPSLTTEFAASSKSQADEEAIDVFADNLRQLLLAPPLGPKRTLGIDPGFRTGCKIVCLDNQGNLLHHEAIFPHAPQNNKTVSGQRIKQLIGKYRIEAIAIGNGTASRETDLFIKGLNLPDSVHTFVVSEDGASVYSASQTARDEFPDKDVTVRGAVSIGRRLMDPLAELVKIEPKSIGVGQYQHDVDQNKLKKKLDETVISCVNSVGVNLNTASIHLLTYVSGLTPTLARNIVEYRKEHGDFKSRNQLKKVPRLGPVVYEQCAGFLRIANAENPLDNSAVHPESYSIVETMAHDNKCTVSELMNNKTLQKSIKLEEYVTDKVGLPTLKDIMSELDKPGRDPRELLELFEFDPNINTIDDLSAGMLLPAIITNITNFGAFADIGVHNDGFIHISEMSHQYIKTPQQVVKLHQHVRVRVIDVDKKRNRISLSLKL